MKFFSPLWPFNVFYIIEETKRKQSKLYGTEKPLVMGRLRNENRELRWSSAFHAIDSSSQICPSK